MSSHSQVLITWSTLKNYHYICWILLLESNHHLGISSAFSRTVNISKALFTSGVWRFDFDPTGTTTLTPSVFLEADVCNPAAGDYGVDDGIAIERAKVDVIVYTGEMA